jgi:hypothetical protein
MLILRGVEKICRSELTLPARLGRQDKSNGAMRRLRRCLHIQDLVTPSTAMSIVGMRYSCCLLTALTYGQMRAASEIPPRQCMV